jgi:hypothetical protein
MDEDNTLVNDILLAKSTDLDGTVPVLYFFGGGSPIFAGCFWWDGSSEEHSQDCLCHTGNCVLEYSTVVYALPELMEVRRYGCYQSKTFLS